MTTSLPKIHCVFFAEFHHITGPKITYQSPEGFIGQEVFEAIHEYLITKPQLCDKLITIKAAGFIFVGHPVAIENKKYERNALLFNLGFVFENGVDTKPFESTIRKLAHYLYSMELESEFIFQQESKSKLQKIISQMHEELNEKQYSIIPIDDSNTLRLKILPLLPDPSEVPDHKVPIFIVDKRRFDVNSWDLAMQQIFPFIDGINHVKRIPLLSDVELDLVRQCLHHLICYGVVVLIDIFQYSKFYTTTSLIYKLAGSSLLQQQCLAFIMQSGALPIGFQVVFSLYSKLSPTTSFKDFCIENNLQELRIDERRFIQFGLIHQFVRSIHEYPVRIAPNDIDESLSNIPSNVSKLLTGKKNTDEICCALGKSYRELHDMLKDDPFTVIIRK